MIAALHGEHVHLSADQVHGRGAPGGARGQPGHGLQHAQRAGGHGEISEIRLSDGTARYDPKVGPDHHHLVCDGCGLTFDVEPRGVSGLSLPPAQRFGMTVDSVEVVFRGRCSNCAEHG